MAWPKGSGLRVCDFNELIECSDTGLQRNAEDGGAAVIHP